MLYKSENAEQVKQKRVSKRIPSDFCVNSKCGLVCCAHCNTVLMPLGWKSHAIHKIKKIDDQCKFAADHEHPADNSEQRIPGVS